MSLNQSIVEDAALEWFGELGCAVGHGPHLTPIEPTAERVLISELVLVARLHEVIRQLNSAIPQSRIFAALRCTLLPKLLSRELSATASLLASIKS
jgi:type I restriction enzyme R subunit